MEAAAPSMEAPAAPDAFELSYMVHMLAMMIPAALHAQSSLTHPGTVHAILATTFGGGAMIRTGLHFSGLKGAEATRLWHPCVAIASVACTFAIHATGRVLPVTAMDLTFIAFCMVVVIFGLIALSDFPAYVLACFVAARRGDSRLCRRRRTLAAWPERRPPARRHRLWPHGWLEAADYVRAPRPASELSPELGGWTGRPGRHVR